MRFVRRLLARRRLRRHEKKIVAYDVFRNSTSESNGRGGTSDETSSTEGSLPVSPWKAENFLENGRISEADWWQEERQTVSDSDGGNNDDDTASEQPERKFVNQGLSLWSQGRDAWKSAKSTEPCQRRDPAAIPESFKKELVKCLGDRRQFELSQRIPLKTMIEAYQEVWNQNPNE